MSRRRNYSRFDWKATNIKIEDTPIIADLNSNHYIEKNLLITLHMSSSPTVCLLPTALTRQAIPLTPLNITELLESGEKAGKPKKITLPFDMPHRRGMLSSLLVCIYCTSIANVQLSISYEREETGSKGVQHFLHVLTNLSL